MRAEVSKVLERAPVAQLTINDKRWHQDLAPHGLSSLSIRISAAREDAKAPFGHSPESCTDHTYCIWQQRQHRQELHR